MSGVDQQTMAGLIALITELQKTIQILTAKLDKYEKNRFHDLNNMIDKQWLNLSLETYKIKCKALFLQNGNQ